MECPAHPPCEVPAAQSGLVAPSSGRSVVPGVHVVSGVGHHVIDLTTQFARYLVGEYAHVDGRIFGSFPAMALLVGCPTAWVGGTGFCV